MSRQPYGSANRLPRTAQRSLTDLAHLVMAHLFAPLARFLNRLGITPNAITVFGCLLSIVGAALIAMGRWTPAIVAVLLGGFADGVDGLLARQSQQTTRFGAFLDSVLDRWSDSALFVGLLVYFAHADLMVEEVLSGVALSLSLLVSYTRARAEGIGARCNRGLFTRLERLSVLVAGLIFGQMGIALWLIVVLSAFTAVQRIYYTWRFTQLNTEG
jgi:CDP-diacylglycerol--glycerol-3-phosphate 3-phosphatidyltransferase